MFFEGRRLYFDGASNQARSRIGVVIALEDGTYYPMITKKFDCTNNMAEYEACIIGLWVVLNMDIKEVMVFGDLDLIIQ